MAKDKKGAQEDPTGEPKQKRTRGPRQPKPDAFTTDDYRDFHVMNEQMLKAEKVKGEGGDDGLLARLLARREKLLKLSTPHASAAEANS